MRSYTIRPPALPEGECVLNRLRCGALLLGVCMMTALPGCAGLPPASRAGLAQEIASASGMKPEVVTASPFELTTYIRIGRPGQNADIYIEGDGQAWLGRTTPSLDPTPTDPVALRLAALDPAVNVIWLARPCQYTKMAAGFDSCPQSYWTDGRLAPEVITALNTAMDTLKTRYRLDRINLIGFSGGGGAAVLLAARRNDVASLRTVAGNVNHALFSQIHNISPMAASLDPHDSSALIRDLPQIHFVGMDDKIVPPALAQSLIEAENQPSCASIRHVEHIRHDSSWADVWPSLLDEPYVCAR
jgi:predicted esterase